VTAWTATAGRECFGRCAEATVEVLPVVHVPDVTRRSNREIGLVLQTTAHIILRVRGEVVTLSLPTMGQARGLHRGLYRPLHTTQCTVDSPQWVINRIYRPEHFLSASPDSGPPVAREGEGSPLGLDEVLRSPLTDPDSGR
jgi:hypothetical protein